MKQLVLDLKSGETNLLEVPAPAVGEGQVLIQTICSVVSPGTERMLVDFGKAGWIEKARQQPERVQQVITKIRTDGLKPTLDAVFSKLDQPMPLGYSQCGIVIGVGTKVPGIRVGDRVASNGPHAEIVSVPYHLVARVPDNVPDESAAFTVLASIALQSIRLLNPTFGETIAVTGLGLIGQLTTQLLQANGCRVIGIDLDEKKLAATAHIHPVHAGEQDVVAAAMAYTNQVGVDGVIITAASGSDELIAQAAQMCRKRGRIILTGVTGLDLKRSDFYEKELSFQVSCSYGPGRYEISYEQQGLDYPIGFVRWTEQRNFEAVLAAMAAGQLQVDKLIGTRVALSGFAGIYNKMDGQHGASLLQYDTAKQHTRLIHVHAGSRSEGHIGIIGAGNFTTGVILPQLKKADALIRTIASKGGLSAASAARKFGIEQVTTAYEDILNDPLIDTVFITTRHHQHAAMAAAALRSGKHVFVEKPLAIDEAGLQEVMAAYQSTDRYLFVGFNRRFAPMAVKMKTLLRHAGGPLNIVMTVNAGILPAKHWLQAPESGGRMIGEICHFIDLAAYLTGAPVTSVCAMETNPDDTAVLLRFANGSGATIHYFTNGSKAYDKERIEVFSDERVLILENWKKLRGYGFKNFTSKSAGQDKGHEAQFREVLETIRNGGAQLIDFKSLINTTRASYAIPESIRKAGWVDIL